jgi:hypothetical protein
MVRIQHLAWRALYVRRKRADEFVVTCIQVDDPTWRPIVDALMPNYDWEAIRATGAEPIASGTAEWSLCEVVAECLPIIADVLLEKPSEGMVKVIVLAFGHCTVYEIEPKQDLTSV